ncbi:hypothetical protein BCR36DRAFT_406649 [Piromyces finnis]|uniref:A to I editase domain-containing protein n=1 Tax=Piromyces finnis TaxID=1754191 RepID=A0A1Y1UZC2_9FUNG|nr:hypothetical protein BCR36DRAFT_406649 [Piromyces finnis]|eukprot:ORX43821.1 hypothetical protein BCR36DRAFT_406649 [Piromyces finnis]
MEPQQQKKISISDRIAKCCIEQYERFQKRFKPSENQWTILAGIVIEYIKDKNNEQQNTELKCVCLSTGMKCIGKSHLLPTGEIINDSHAEVLSRRAFQKYIYSEIESCIDNKDSIVYYNKETKKFKVHENLRFHLYISQSPCGDASTVSLSELQTEEEKLINENKKRIFNEKQNSNKQMKLDNENILRGRLNYDKLGVLRTKPGRIDADPTLSMSCSDKILKWTFLGIEGSLLMYFLEKPIYLSSVTVEDMYDEVSLNRALITRVDDVKELPLPFERNKPDIWKSSQYLFPYTKRYIEEKNKEKASSQIKDLSNKKKKRNRVKADDKALYWNKVMNQPEVIINGRKQGASPKNGIYNKKTWSDLCKYKMFEQFFKTYHYVLQYQQKQQQQQQQITNKQENLTNFLIKDKLEQKSYQEFKNESKTYKKAKDFLFYGKENNSQNKIKNGEEPKSTSLPKKGILNGWTEKPHGFQDFKLDFS